MVKEILQAFILIFFAEMGDKTQILAMAFATQYPVKKVLIGIAIGSFLNHGLAVLLGSFLSTKLPIDAIQLISGFAFIGFAIWTLRVEDDEEEESSISKYGAIATVAIAFFIGELGDKTQLTAITLSADASYPIFILVGTVLGMVVTGGLGIYVGKKMGEKIPEFAIKIISSSVFMIFGLQKVYMRTPEKYLNGINVILFMMVILIIFIVLINKLYRHEKSVRLSGYQKQAQLLYEHFKSLEAKVENICLGDSVCKSCEGKNCEVGYAKKIIELALNNESEDIEGFFNINIKIKQFDQEKLMICLAETIQLIEKIDQVDETHIIHVLRKHLEKMIIGEAINNYQDIETYKRRVEKSNLELLTIINENISS
jgi:putative Ca2+/H+ antiporter (TMEM165/GDT1 family)